MHFVKSAVVSLEFHSAHVFDENMRALDFLSKVCVMILC